MGIKRSNLAKAVASAFTALGDIPESVTYRRVTSTYANGVNTKANADTTVTAVFTKFSKVEIDRVSILATDVKCIFQQSDLELTPIIASDKVVRGTKVFNIVTVEQDPASVVWILQLRAP